MEEVKKENENVHITYPTHHEKKNMTEKVRQNPWILSTFIFGIIVMILLLGNVFGFGITGKAVSESKAGTEVVGFINKYLVNGGASLDSVEKDAKIGVYVVNIKYKNNTLPMYLSNDGQYLDFGAGMVNMNAYIKSLSSPSDSTDTGQPAQNAPKTDKPNVELYVFTYCPYGLQMEKAMIPVVKLLGNKINFKIRQIGAMHGDFEKVEAQRQLCIEKNYPDKFLDYVLAFAEDTSCSNGAETCLTTKVNSLYTKLGMDASKINACIPTEGLTMYNAEVSNANSKGVSGSPTLMINGVDIQASRSADGIKTAVCNAFNTSPSECSQTLSTSQASAGFGAGASSGSSSASCG